MNDREFGNKIKQDLNYGLGRLDARVTERLKQARERALDAYAAQEQTASSSPYALAGHHGQVMHHPALAPLKWLPLAMLMLALLGVMYWQQEMNADEDIDVALLASDIPLNVYTDHD
ncbi:MAG: hypothetical protein A2Z44_07990, partial [Betaproteobacteria bacterium RBG_19FT_COMBO_58_11]